MGDGIHNKHALIINGDANQQHLNNVDQAMATLSSAGVSSVHVVSPAPPRGQLSSYAAPNKQYLEKTVQGLARQTDNDDLLIVYIQGHAGMNSFGEACFPLQDACLNNQELEQALQPLDFGEILLVRDECQGDDPLGPVLASGQYFLSSVLVGNSLLSPVISGALQGMFGSMVHHSGGLAVLNEFAHPAPPTSYAL